MKWFSNFKIKVKLIVCFIVLAIFTGIVGTVGIISMNNMNTRSEKMYNNNFVPAQELAKIQTGMENIRANHLLVVYERDAKSFQVKLDIINKLVEETNNVLTNYKGTISNEEEENLYNNLMNSLTAYRIVRNENLDMIKSGKYDEALATLTKVTTARLKVDGELQQLIDFKGKDATKAINENAANFKNQSGIMIITILIGIGFAISLGLIVASIISKPLNQLVNVANKIADGNLDVNIDIDTKDEVGILASAFTKMADNINEVMGNISNASEQVASGAKQVSDSSMELSQGATEQASSIEQLTASIEEISSQTKLNADNANKANDLSEIAKENAVQGNNQMKDMLKAMEEINESSSSISKIIKVIDEIAFQTNILALNAAVEAARAGQHGKGFAVVAEEVRNLAARSASAAKETTDMIEGSVKKVDEGTKIANETAAALDSIVEGVSKVADLVSDIAVASNEQSLAIGQINQGVMQVSQVVQMNSATSEESAAASEELSSQAELLKDMVNKFKLKQISYNDGNLDGISPEVLRMLEGMSQKKKLRLNVNDAVYKEGTTGELKIALSDKEFGKY